jgi:hypothetical protein
VGGVFSCAGLAAEAAGLASQQAANPDDPDLECQMLQFELDAIDGGCFDFLSSLAPVGAELDQAEARADVLQRMADAGCQ